MNDLWCAILTGRMMTLSRVTSHCEDDDDAFNCFVQSSNLFSNGTNTKYNTLKPNSEPLQAKSNYLTLVL